MTGDGHPTSSSASAKPHHLLNDSRPPTGLTSPNQLPLDQSTDSPRTRRFSLRKLLFASTRRRSRSGPLSSPSTPDSDTQNGFINGTTFTPGPETIANNETTVGSSTNTTATAMGTGLKEITSDVSLGQAASGRRRSSTSKKKNSISGTTWYCLEDQNPGQHSDCAAISSPRNITAVATSAVSTSTSPATTKSTTAVLVSTAATALPPSNLTVAGTLAPPSASTSSRLRRSTAPAAIVDSWSTDDWLCQGTEVSDQPRARVRLHASCWGFQPALVPDVVILISSICSYSRIWASKISKVFQKLRRRVEILTVEELGKERGLSLTPRLCVEKTKHASYQILILSFDLLSWLERSQVDMSGLLHADRLMCFQLGLTLSSLSALQLPLFGPVSGWRTQVLSAGLDQQLDDTSRHQIQAISSNYLSGGETPPANPRFVLWPRKVHLGLNKVIVVLPPEVQPVANLQVSLSYANEEWMLVVEKFKLLPNNALEVTIPEIIFNASQLVRASVKVNGIELGHVLVKVESVQSLVESAIDKQLEPARLLAGAVGASTPDLAAMDGLLATRLLELTATLSPLRACLLGLDGSEEPRDSLLHLAARFGLDQLANSLLKLGFDRYLSMVGSSGLTPAMLADNNGHTYLASKLRTASGLPCAWSRQDFLGAKLTQPSGPGGEDAVACQPGPCRQAARERQTSPRGQSGHGGQASLRRQSSVVGQTDPWGQAALVGQAARGQVVTARQSPVVGQAAAGGQAASRGQDIQVKKTVPIEGEDGYLVPKELELVSKSVLPVHIPVDSSTDAPLPLYDVPRLVRPASNYDIPPSPFPVPSNHRLPAMLVTTGTQTPADWCPPEWIPSVPQSAPSERLAYSLSLPAGSKMTGLKIRPV